MTCVDRFSKMVILVPLRETDARHVADRFLAEVVSHHGLPTRSLVIVTHASPDTSGKN